MYDRAPTVNVNTAMNQIQFLQVYIAEAHAQDEWPIGSKRYQLNQHKSLEDRAAASRQQMDVPWPVFLDGMDDKFLHTYGAWPTRFYIFDDRGKMVYLARPQKCAFNPHELEEKLAELVKL